MNVQNNHQWLMPQQQWPMPQQQWPLPQQWPIPQQWQPEQQQWQLQLEPWMPVSRPFQNGLQLQFQYINWQNPQQQQQQQQQQLILHQQQQPKEYQHQSTKNKQLKVKNHLKTNEIFYDIINENLGDWDFKKQAMHFSKQSYIQAVHTPESMHQKCRLLRPTPFTLNIVKEIRFLITLSIAWRVGSVKHHLALPNILLVLSDDQDTELHGLHPLQQTMQLFSKYGTQFTNAFTSTPICCPSRASLLTGQYAHNHRTFNNSLDGGCNGLRWREQFEPRALPVLLQKNGYRTFFAGKYLNQFKGGEVPPGWYEFHGLHGNSRYYNYTLRENAKNVSYTETYLTDLLTDRAAAFIRSTMSEERQKPFFALISPPAPHEPFTPAPRHAGVFADVLALRTPSFNAHFRDKHWLVGSGKSLSNNTVITIDKYFQKRWESLLSVDEMMKALVTVLNETQCFQNTYIIYTSDNGYHLGQFAQPFDKRQPYETDIKVPLLILGPDVPANQVIHLPVSLLDIAPTILEWAGVSVPDYMDGRSFKSELLNAHNMNLTLQPFTQRTLLIEYWGEGNDNTFNSLCPGKRSDHLAQCTLVAECHCQDSWNNTFACVRDFRYNLNRIYCEFQDSENFVEAYDLESDPYQLQNIGYDMLPIERALYSILLKNLTRCAGKACYM